MLLVSYEEDMNRVPCARSQRESKLHPRQEIKLGRMPEISIINYNCFACASEDTILLIKTTDVINELTSVLIDLPNFRRCLAFKERQ